MRPHSRFVLKHIFTPVLMIVANQLIQQFLKVQHFFKTNKKHHEKFTYTFIHSMLLYSKNKFKIEEKIGAKAEFLLPFISGAIISLIGIFYILSK